MTFEIAPARTEWFDRMSAIAVDGGSPDAHPAHFAFLASHGRLLAAIVGDEVIGFGGTTPAHGAHMVTDLFVTASHRGRGVGTALLSALLDGASAAFTFSSTHPAALAAYDRAGLARGWPLLTMRGVANGGGELLASGEWRHDRPEIAEHVLTQHGWCTGDVLVSRSGDFVRVLRMVGDSAPDDALSTLMAGFAVGADVELSVPAHSPALAWLMLHGFRIVDVDIFCSTPGVVVPENLWVVHRGLC